MVSCQRRLDFMATLLQFPHESSDNYLFVSLQLQMASNYTLRDPSKNIEHELANIVIECFAPPIMTMSWAIEFA